VQISIQISPSVAVEEERRPNGGKEAAKKTAVKNGGESTAKNRQKCGKRRQKNRT
jgi:hypothetical protein